MSNKPKMTKDTIPEDFTLSLALVDALPVLFFGGSMILIGVLFGSVMFMLGAVLCFWAGAAKVLWKVIVVKKKNQKKSRIPEITIKSVTASTGAEETDRNRLRKSRTVTGKNR